MDVSYLEHSGVIEWNITVMSFEELETVEGNIPTTPSLPEGYETKFISDLTTDLRLAKEKMFICSRSNIMELFIVCMRQDSSIPLVEIEDRFNGSTMEIKWQCMAGHSGRWQSTEAVNRVYVNNLQAGASLLYSGKNFTKMSLFAKCFELAFISFSTFHRYQKKHLA